MSVEVGPKLLELLHEAVPTATAIALLIKPKNPMPRTRRRICGCCPQAGPAVYALNASTEADFDPAFSKLQELAVGALMIGRDAFFNGRSSKFAALSIDHAMCAIYPSLDFLRGWPLMRTGPFCCISLGKPNEHSLRLGWPAGVDSFD